MSQLKSELLAGRECFVYLPTSNSDIGSEIEKKRYPVLYLHGDNDTKELLDKSNYLEHMNCIIIGIMDENRISELTPWEAKSLHPKFQDFGGKALEYITWITEELKKEVDEKYETLSSPEHTGIIGYSLGGLCSVYSLYLTNIFGVIASMSGSFWYPNFISFSSTEELKSKNAYIYLSSGDSEGVGHKDIKKDAVLNTKQIYDILGKRLGTEHVELHFDKGGHHNNKDARHEKALLWMNEVLSHKAK